MPICQTQLATTAGWSGTLHLHDLSKGVDYTLNPTGEPRPVGISVSFSFLSDLATPPNNLLTFAVERVSPVEADWTTATNAWMTAWGIPHSSWGATNVVMRVVVRRYDGLELYERLICYGYDDEAAPGVEPPEHTPVWVWYGPVGGQQDVEDLDFTWSVALTTGVKAQASFTSSPPAYRDRQDFSDDSVDYPGWKVAAQNLSWSFDGNSGTTTVPETILEDLVCTIGISNGGTLFTGLNYEHVVIENPQTLSTDWTYLDNLHSCADSAGAWTNYPDGTTPAGTRYLVDGNTAAKTIAFSRIGDPVQHSETTESIGWSGSIYAPLRVTFDYQPHKFHIGEHYTGLPRLDLGLRYGDGTTPLYLLPGETVMPAVYKYSWHDHTGDWYGSTNLQAYVLEADLNALDMNPQRTVTVGVTNYSFSDRRVKLYVWPLTATDYTASPLFSAHGILDIELTPNLDLNGVVSSWYALGGGTVSGTNGKTWTVQRAGAVFRRDLVTRYYTQMECLVDTPPGYSHDDDWPLKLKANITQIAVPEWDAATQAKLTATEDITNWSNRSYLRVNLPGDYNGLFAVTLYTSTVAYSRAADHADWTYTRTENDPVTYTRDRDGALLNLTTGTRQFDLDLAHPEGTQPSLLHVDAIEVTFLEAPVGNQSVTLDTLSLIVSDRAGEENHFQLSGKTAWGWLHTNFFGVRWIVDGLNNDQHDWYGNTYWQNEKGLQYISQVFTGPKADNCVAKDLERLATELNWQEGITATWTAAGWTALFTDADSNVFGQTAWWDIEENPDQAIDNEHLMLGLAVGSVDITHLRGPELKFTIVHHLTGEATGIARRGYRRIRNTGGVVPFYYCDVREGGVGWTLLGRGATDEHGRYTTEGAIEDGESSHTHDRGRGYRVGRGDSLGAAVNRSYWVAPFLAGEGGLKLTRDRHGAIWVVYSNGTNLVVRYQTDPRVNAWSDAVAIASASDYDSADIEVREDGYKWVLALRVTDNVPCAWKSLDGIIWTAVGAVT